MGCVAISWNGLAFAAVAEAAGHARSGAALGLQQTMLAVSGGDPADRSSAPLVAATSWRLGFAVSALFPLVGMAAHRSGRPLRVASPHLDVAEREMMTWDDLGDGARELAEAVWRDGYRPDIILAIARGGLLVAGALSYALGVKNTFTMNVEFYTGVDERLEMPMILPPVPDLVDFSETQVLIADDVADTGRDPRARRGVPRGEGRRDALRRPLREAALDREVRVRLAPHRPLDRLPLERPARGRERSCCSESV